MRVKHHLLQVHRLVVLVVVVAVDSVARQVVLVVLAAVAQVSATLERKVAQVQQTLAAAVVAAELMRVRTQAAVTVVLVSSSFAIALR